MTPPALFLLAVLIPVFFASPRSTPVWLTLQALALSWNAAALHGVHSEHAGISLAEILAIRGALVPWLLHRSNVWNAESVDHLLPSNLFSWILGIALALLAYQFAAGAVPGEAALPLGAASTTLVLALLVLSSNAAGAAQVFALLLLENAALLFESTLTEPWSLWVHGALTSIYVLTVVAATRLVRHHREGADLDLPSKAL